MLGLRDGSSGSTVRRALANTVLNGVRFSAILVANLVTSVLIAHGLGPAGTGGYSFACWLAGTLALLASIGLPATLTKFVAEYVGRGEADIARALGRSLVRWAVASAVVLALIGAGITALAVRADQRILVWLALALLVPQAIQQISTSALAGWQRYDRIARLSLAGAATQVGFVMAAWALRAGLLGMLAATVAGATVWGGLAYRVCASVAWRGAATAPAHELREAARRVRRFWWATAYTVVLDVVIWQRSEVLFLKWFGTLEQVAFYSLAFGIAGKLGQVATVFTNVLLPICAERFGRSGLQELWPVYRQALRYVQMAIVPLCVYGIVLAGPVSRWMYGVRFAAMTFPLQLLFAALAWTCIGSVASSVALGVDRPDITVRVGTPVAVLNIGLEFLLIGRLHYGAAGAAWADAAAQVIGVAGGLWYLHRILGEGYPWASSMRIGLAALVSATPLGYFASRWPMNPLLLGAGAVAALAVYPAVLAILGEASRADWDLAVGLLRWRGALPTA